MSGSRGGRRRLAALLLLWLLPALACGRLPAQEDGRGHPTIWRARRGDAGTLFLLGSVHLGRPASLPLGERFEQVWRQCDEVVLEVDLGGYDAAEGQRLMDRYGRVPLPATLQDRVSQPTWELFVAYRDARKLSPASLDPYEPWVVATLIAVLELRALGYDPQHGVDRVLLERAVEAGKPVVGVETLEAQLATVAALPEAVQDLMLRDMLLRADDFADEASAMLEAWSDGRDEALARIALRHLGDPAFEPFYASILFDRNLGIAERIAGLAEDGRTRLVVVGVAHMLGDRGIPALLAQQGFDVEVLE